MSVRNSSARRERARERVKRDILLAAGEVFARRGYAAATLAELAEAAGFAPPSLYRYFESKEEIFRSLVELLADELSATFRAPADRSLPLAGRLEALLRAQEALAAERASLYKLMARPPLDAPGLLGGLPLGDPGAGLAFYEEQLLAWLRRNAARRELRVPPEALARGLAGITFAFHHCRGARPLAGDPARIAVDLALRGAAAAGAPDGPSVRRGA
jgi:AcrR family transcriptional regulator